MHEEAVTKLKIYVIDKNVETLLSGEACEDLRILKFMPSTQREEKEEIRRITPKKDEYKRKVMTQHPRLFISVGTLKNFQVELHIDKYVKPGIAHN